MTSRILMSGGPPRAPRGMGRFAEARAFLTDNRRHGTGPSPHRDLYPVTADERREHFRLRTARTVAALSAFLSALAIFVLGVSL